MALGRSAPCSTYNPFLRSNNLISLAAWNTGTCLFIIWSGLSCLNQFINSIVWRDNAINWAPVWCDISTKFIIGSSVAIPAASLCINRRLYHIATVRTVTVSSEEKRRAVLVDLAIGLGLPVVEMVLRKLIIRPPPTTLPSLIHLKYRLYRSRTQIQYPRRNWMLAPHVQHLGSLRPRLHPAHPHRPRLCLLRHPQLIGLQCPSRQIPTAHVQTLKPQLEPLLPTHVHSRNRTRLHSPNWVLLPLPQL